MWARVLRVYIAYNITCFEIQRSLVRTPVRAIPWISQIEIRPAHHAVNGTGLLSWEVGGLVDMCPTLINSVYCLPYTCAAMHVCKTYE